MLTMKKSERDPWAGSVKVVIFVLWFKLLCQTWLVITLYLIPTLKNDFYKLNYLMLPLFYSKMLFWLYIVCDTAMSSQRMILVLRWPLAILKGREEEVLVN